MSPERAPLLSAVGWTLGDALEALGPLDLLVEERPAEFATQDAGAGARRVLVAGAGWVSADRRLSVRYARVQTASADVATVMVYPVSAPCAWPVFAAEWVVVGPRCHVAVLDVEAVDQDPRLLGELSAPFGELARRWRDRLPAGPESPAWFEAIRAPWALNTSLAVTELVVLRAACREYLRAYMAFLMDPGRRAVAVGSGTASGLDSAREPEHAAVLRYKRHHLEHFPGRPLLATKVGEAWTEEFLARWHFGPVVDAS